MRNVRVGIVALVSAVMLLISGNAWAATYSTIFDEASWNGETFDVDIFSDREEIKGDEKCTKGRLVEFYQKKDGGGRRDLAQKRTGEGGIISNFLPDRLPKKDLGDIFVKATKHEINDKQICAAEVTVAAVV